MHIITITKQIAKVVFGPFRAIRPGAGAPASDQTDTLALRFGGPEDAINFARNGIEDANRRAASNAVDFVKGYNEGKLCIVLKVTAGVDLGDHDLIFVPVKDGRRDRSPRQDGIPQRDAATCDANGHQEPMLVGVTELVEGPEGVIPSLMRIERSKQRADFRRQILASSVSDPIKISNGVPKGEVRVLGLSDACFDGNGVATLIQSGSERFDGLRATISPAIGDSAREAISMGCDALRISLGETFSWFLFEESGDTLFKPTDMLICPSEPTFGAVQ